LKEVIQVTTAIVIQLKLGVVKMIEQKGIIVKLY